MRAMIQRVSEASVVVEHEVVGQIAHGLVVLLGVGANDEPNDALILAQKLIKLRIFSDDAGKMNRSLIEVQGSVLSISQFTLYAELQSGNRPSFFEAAPPALAKELYEWFNFALQTFSIPVHAGIFGANMQVRLVNDGPVTLFLDSEVLKTGKKTA